MTKNTSHHTHKNPEKPAGYGILKFLLLLLILALFGFAGYRIYATMQANKEEPVAAPEVRVKRAEVLTFGQWRPESSREVLGTLEKDEEVNVISELSGTLDRVYVDIGDSVTQGQVIARYNRSGDSTQVSLDNAELSLTTTRLASENSVRNAEISVETAQRSLQQTILTQQQSLQKALDDMRNNVRNGDTTISNFLNWADRLIGVSSRYQYEFVHGRREVGARDTVNKQRAKDLIWHNINTFNSLPEIPPRLPDENTVLDLGEGRLAYLKSVKELSLLMDELVRDSLITRDFDQDDRDALRAESEGYLSSLNTLISSIETQLEGIETTRQSVRQSILTAQNALDSARSGLELTQAQADQSIATAQNSVRLAQNSALDLDVRAPFSGTVVEKSVSAGEQVSVGTPLITLLGSIGTPKVVAYLTKDEFDRVKSAQNLTIRTDDDQEFQTQGSQVSGRIDAASQKIRAQLLVPAVPKDLLVGSFVKVLLPSLNGSVRMLPISAISFEPDGAEVIIVNAENIAERRKVTTGKIISNTIEITDGIEEGERVAVFRTRLTAGDTVDPQE